ncbi:hypothetical protein CONLIGDRAFT_644337 [Coniochaeta ligniaria NRRL 30616]|uniref:Uncharacterized protein n=1 Tax=Coniochaeta ligniaria NRRL 30616 TaxID=1408157 RepID=A0A1J7IRQ9_9PEZI|nr:hypothetical protein CONLIGDRAFT_644337 [Coniochaeta ligniaria NRRL 30616]
MRFFRRKDKQKEKTLGLPGFGNGEGHNGDGKRKPSGSSPQYSGAGGAATTQGATAFRPMATHRSAATLLSLPPHVLEKVFGLVCPHATDKSYQTCEESGTEDACMLCDLRDLAHCVAVCKKWRTEAIKLLYKSIRIDTVHYCQREATLSDLRKRGSFFDRNADPEDPTAARLKLLCRTLREDPARLGPRVEFLKTPYMLRESAQADLARTIAVLPNLKYVDLPEGMYMDETSYLTLRLEVQARCREIRKMTYMHGSERSLQQLANGNIWTKLEVLELVKIDMDPSILRQVLSALTNMRALKVSETKTFTDEMFYWSDMVPPFPVLEEFILNEVPNVTAEGLKQWLVFPEVQSMLKVLSLNHTGVKAFTLHQVLAIAPALKHLSITDNVMSSMPTAAGTHNVPPLASKSLEALHFEITSSNSVSAASATASYYNYLASSLLSGGLPNLGAVYVRDPNFPDTLLGLPPPKPGFAEGGYARPASSGSNSTFSSHLSSSPGFAPISPQTSLSPGHPSFMPGQSPYHNRFPSNQSNFLQPQQQASNPRFSSNNPFANHGAPHSIANLPARLEVFTKSGDELVWSFYGRVKPPRDKSPRRPLSSYGLGNDVLGGSAMGWSPGGGARRSVFIGGAGGQFLQVPGDDAGARGRQHRKGGSTGGGGARSRLASGKADDEGEDVWPRPNTSAGGKKSEDMDLWR